MNYFWTIQSRKVVDIVNSEGEYYPSFTNRKKDYRIVLESFNANNKTDYKGLVFGFAKRNREGCFENVDELYEYLFQNPLVTDAFDFWDKEHVILKLETRENFNQIPIDFNDFNQITFPIWGMEVNKNIINLVNKGYYNDNSILPSFTQIHIPYIKKEMIVNIYGNFNKKRSDAAGELSIFQV
ncbi:hypothetical protein IAI10_09925 [Clostridium sp. 19966]|uniref:hypothetical protein n=1 Tax=Clostridium sp. 19966 TaxID=2768166 RepID=UPI0028DEE091|nr:hypothetical protein [Clostridium sp. 19966]MDT8716975.1 hypothetical protein [Clostridium sp. 19966]